MLACMLQDERSSQRRGGDEGDGGHLGEDVEGGQAGRRTACGAGTMGRGWWRGWWRYSAGVVRQAAAQEAVMPGAVPALYTSARLDLSGSTLSTVSRVVGEGVGAVDGAKGRYG